MSEVNVDVCLVEEGNIFFCIEEKLVEMSNGCICCILWEDLIEEVVKLVQEGWFDYLLIESMGIFELLFVVQIFFFDSEELKVNLLEVSELDMLVIVVDVFNFYWDFGSVDIIFFCEFNDDLFDQCIIVNLLVDQFEFVNVILFNKMDLVMEEQVQEFEVFICKFNVDVKIICMQYSKVVFLEILNIRFFDYECISQFVGWIKELYEEYIFEIEEYGIFFFVFWECCFFYLECFW